MYHHQLAKEAYKAKLDFRYANIDTLNCEQLLKSSLEVNVALCYRMLELNPPLIKYFFK